MFTCKKHNYTGDFCGPCSDEKMKLDGTICSKCEGMIQSWRHQAGHVIVFCNCPSPKMVRCSHPNCKDKYYNKENVHPHRIFQPNINMFLKYGTMYSSGK